MIIAEADVLLHMKRPVVLWQGHCKATVERGSHYRLRFSVGELTLDKPYSALDFNKIETNPVRCADPELATQMEAYIKDIRKKEIR